MAERTPRATACLRRVAPAPLASPRDVARALRRAVLVIGAAGILVLPQFMTNASFAGVAGMPGPVAALLLGLAFWLMPILLVASWVAESRAWLPHPWLTLPVGLFIVGAAVSTALAVDQASALVRAAEMTGLWVGFWALAQALRTDGERRLLAAALVAAALVVALVAIHQRFIGLPDAYEYYQQHRAEVLAQQGIEAGGWMENRLLERFTTGVQASLGHPNVLAAFLVLGVLVAVGLAREKWSAVPSWEGRGLAIVVAVVALVCTVGVFLTHGRAGVAALVLGLYWLAVTWWVKRPGLRWKLIVVPLAVGVLALAVMAFIPQAAVVKAMTSLRYRLDYWVATASILWHHGLAGVGLENFGLYYPEFKLPTAPEEIRDPHNLVLSMWSSLGLAGLVSLVSLAILAVRAWRRAESAARLEPAAVEPAVVEPALEPATEAAGGPRRQPLAGLLVATIVVAAPGVIAFFLLGWPLGAGAIAIAMIVMALCVVDGTHQLEIPERPLGSARTACIVALVAFVLMEQVGTAIFEPPTAWAMLVVLALTLPAARGRRARDSAGAVPAAAGEPGVRLGLLAKSLLILLAMVVGYAYTQKLLVPFGQEWELFTVAGTSADPTEMDEALQDAAKVNPPAWEPALARARLWQSAAQQATGIDQSTHIERAVEAYQEVLARQPRMRQAYVALADCLLLPPGAMESSREAWKGALRYLEESRRLYPTDLRTQSRIASLTDHLGDARRALAEYQRALDLDAQMPEQDRRIPEEIRREIKRRIAALEESLAKPAAKP